MKTVYSMNRFVLGIVSSVLLALQLIDFAQKTEPSGRSCGQRLAALDPAPDSSSPSTLSGLQPDRTS
jgi:hypothetical protein